MASGSTASSGGRGGGKGFDFASDHILSSYEDYGNQDPSNSSSHSDPSKDFHKSRISRSSVFPAGSYDQPEDSFNQEILHTVERSMKKHTDNLMRFLEGISSRLCQLELYCYNLDKSIGEMRTDLIRDHGEADTKLKFLEKHLQEVHRSVQILRDKQELADTQKELAKLQLAQKESSSLSHSQSTGEKVTSSAGDNKKDDQQSEVPNQQLALALPHQVLPQQQPPPPPLTPPSQAPPQTGAPQQSYYLAPPPLPPAPSAQTQHPQSQYLPADLQYRAPQMQDVSRIPPQQVSQNPTGQQYPQYQQQWPQQVPPPQPPSVQPQVRPPTTTVYSTYLPPGQTQVQTPEAPPNSMHMQVTYSAVPQPISSRADGIPYGYGSGRPVPQQPPPQQVKNAFGAQQGDAYATGGPHFSPSGGAYMIYDGEGGRHHQPQPSPFPQDVYPPNLSHQSPQTAAGANMLTRSPSPSPYHRNHPYNELTEKLVNMGFRGDHVVGVIQRMEESGQPVDFNSVLDRLNVHSSGVSQRGWSG